MIDYNLSPSFILSEQPSHYLSSTPSAELYSTEFAQYENLIRNVYNQVNGVLNQVIGYSWTGRKVLENGVIMNTYRKGADTKEIIINYTNDAKQYENAVIAPLSASVAAKEVTDEE
jgi:MinD-like ATPase involved in chromosome partitioning or flagellar assembly